VSGSADNWREATRITTEQAVIPHTQVSVYQALYDRRMAWKFKDKPVPKGPMERMLDALGSASLALISKTILSDTFSWSTTYLSGAI